MPDIHDLEIIPRPMHAATDYVYGAAILAAPKLAGFDDEPGAVLATRVHGAVTIAASLCTRYELGVLKLIPFKVHLLLDVAGGVLGLAAPWLFGFAHNKKARNTLLGFALFELLAVAISRKDNYD